MRSASTELILSDSRRSHSFVSFVDNNCSLAFKPLNSYASHQNSRPRSIALSDLNEDDQLDLAVVNENTDSIGVSLGYANDQFRSLTSYSTGVGSRPCFVAVDDVNNDNHMDIIVANYGTHTIGIFLGFGNGSFTTPQLLSTGIARPLSFVLGHLDSDDRLDLVVVNYGTQSIDVFLGFGNGSFASPINYWTGDDSLPWSIALADFNGDRFLDIVVANYGTNCIGVFLGHGNGTFVKQKSYPTGLGSRPYSVAVGDFNRDNRSDITVANSGTGSVIVYIGTGRGTFERTLITITDTFGPLYLVVADFNKDSRLDIAIANNWNDSIYLMLGNGDGTFRYSRVHSTGFESFPCSIVTGDVNSDGRLDIVVANNGSNNVGIFLGQDTGVFRSDQLYSTGPSSNPKSVVVNDFNQDNIMDIAVSNNQADTIGIFLGTPTEVFLNQTTYSTGSNSSPSFIASGDFNKDSHLDLVITASKADYLGFFFGDSSGTFAEMVIVSTGKDSSPQSVGVGDLNQDTNLDLVVGKYGTASIGVFLGYGNGSFSNETIYTTEGISNPATVVIADMNRDTHLDVIVADSLANNFSIFYGDGNGEFLNSTIYTSYYGLSATSLAVKDVNQDDHLDIVIAYSLSHNVGVFLGDSNGTFTNAGMYSNDVYSPPYSVALGDFNNDQMLDIIVANYATDSIGMFLGSGNGSFANQVEYPTGNNSGPWAMAVSQMNDDDRLDIVVTYSFSDSVAVLLGFDDGDMRNQSTLTTGAAAQPMSVAVADFNHDGELDIAIANYGTEDISIRLRFRNDSFANETIYPVGVGSLPSAIVVGDVNNDGDVDLITANFGSATISVFNGYGNGTFALKTTCSTGPASRPISLVLGHFNNDTWLDLVVANSGSDSLDVFLGYRYVAFASQQTYAVQILSHPLSVVAGDFNNDHHLDIVASTDGQASGCVFLGYGNGSFASALPFSIETFRDTQLIDTGDWDQDGCLDLVTVNVFQSFFSIFRGHCNGTFENLAIYSTGNQSYPTSIAVADFNHDHYDDIVLTTSATNTITVLLNSRQGAFVKLTQYSTGANSSPNALAVDDFNHDNHSDIAVTNYRSSEIGIFFGNGDGTFEDQISYSTGTDSSPNMIAVGDFDGDGALDILIVDANTNRIDVLFGYVNGSFAEQVTYSITLVNKPSSISINDFNGDDRLDMAVTSSEKATLRVYYGKGDGTFGMSIVYDTGAQSSPMSLAIGDYNGDQQKDIAIANYATSSVGIFLGYCCESFVSSTTYPTGNNSNPYSVALGDVNNDERTDLIVVHSNLDTVGIFLGYGDGTFGDQTTISTGLGSHPISVAVGDMNNDGSLDIIVANYDRETIGLFFGYGNGSFVNMFTYDLGIGSRPYSVTVCDLNKDHRLDIVISDDGTNNVIILYGHGNGVFSEVASFATGYDSHPYSIAFGDFNNGTTTDIIVSLLGTSSVGVISEFC